MNAPTLLPWLAAALLLTGCAEPTPPSSAPETVADTAAASAAATPTATTPETIPRNANRNAYYGDLHVHTQYSFDAFVFGTRATPDQAYRYAKGEALKHPAGFEMQMPRPLDFQAVTDHGTYLGMMPAMFDANTKVYEHPTAIATRQARNAVERREAFNQILPRIGGQLEGEDDLLDLGIVRTAWQDIVAAAEAHNDPGTFTTFIGYEYTTGGPNFENLHRNVIFAGSDYPGMPYTRLISTNPEDMWDWLDDLRAQGIEGLAIPHNSNGSDGWMFQTTDWNGKPIDSEYAQQRMRNEPLVENTQVKGTSDTHPLLSPNDEWASFEIMPVRIATDIPSKPRGSYIREAYRNGLQMEAEQGFNPYHFGVLGSSDTHNAAGSFEEDNYFSKTGLLDATPALRGSVPQEKPRVKGEPYLKAAANDWGASGLAAVWAESNTREDIYAAFRRKETFSTSGPFIPVRFFAGYDLPTDLLSRDDPIALLYEKAVTMGGDLTAQAQANPTFFLWASRDANSYPLQRLQIIKGWIADGESFERVYDVACSGDAAVDPKTHRCPDNGARVDLANCATSGGGETAQLQALWQDPEFDGSQHAFYYLRVLENPSCRWSSWDAVRAGTPLNPDMPATLQERAWSSPIWIRPSA
ncbi:MAG: DUF3604 domain-containing protein [Pseudomonadota bacterium]